MILSSSSPSDGPLNLRDEVLRQGIRLFGKLSQEPESGQVSRAARKSTALNGRGKPVITCCGDVNKKPQSRKQGLRHCIFPKFMWISTDMGS